MRISDAIFLTDKQMFQTNADCTRQINGTLKVRAYQHLAFWIALFLLSAVSQGYLTGALKYNMICFGLRSPFIMAAVYFNLYFLIPEFYYRGKFGFFLGSILVSTILLNTINLVVMGMLMKWSALPPMLKADAQFTQFSFIGKLVFMMTVVLLTTGIKLSKDHFLQMQKAEQLEKEQLTTELSLLKSQLQPHFFFNTLNNLYALTLKKSDLAPEVVLKLSDFMSYVLYETDQEKTTLIKEVSYIQNFIDLESLRFGIRPSVTFETQGTLEGVVLPPLLLLPFIENSFKHSLQSAASSVDINIRLTVSENTLDLMVINPCSEIFQQKKSGIGLRNVKRRLDLIYGRSYSLNQKREQNQFMTELQLQLT